MHINMTLMLSQRYYRRMFGSRSAVLWASGRSMAAVDIVKSAVEIGQKTV